MKKYLVSFLSMAFFLISFALNCFCISVSAEIGEKEYSFSLQASEVYNNTVTVRAYINNLMADENEAKSIGGIQIVLNYENNGFFLAEISNGTSFLSASTKNYSHGQLVFACDNIKGINVNGESLLFTATFSVNENAEDGEYNFELYCRELYVADAATTDIPYDKNKSTTKVWIGDKLQILPNFVELTVGTSQELSANKTVSQWYSTDPKIVTVDKNGKIMANSVGSAYIMAVGGLNDSETASCRVNVNSNSILMMTVKSYPVKLQYDIGDTVDLSGLELNVTYTDQHFEVIQSGFTCNEYDFSTPGYTEIKIVYKNAWVYVTVHVGNETGINSDYYDVSENYISGVLTKTTVQSFTNKLHDNKYITVYSGPTQITDNNVTTGMLAVLKVNNDIVETKEIVVDYDVNSDGECNICDLVHLKKASAGKIELLESQLIAVRSKENAPSSSDLARMRIHLLMGLN